MKVISLCIIGLIAATSFAANEAKIETAVRDWFLNRTPENLTVLVDRVTVPRINGVHGSNVNFQIKNRTPLQWAGRTALFVDVYKGSDRLRTLSVMVYASIETWVPIATTDIPRGAHLGDYNVEWESRRIDQLQGELIQPNAMQSMRARTTIRSGTLITDRFVEEQPLVERNKPVRVLAKNGPLSITMRATALDTAGAGESVRVKNNETGKIFLAQVVGAGDVEITLH